MPTRVNFESQIKLIPIESACKYATTTNIPFSSISTIDGFSLATNDRVLVWQQTLPEENGIYIVSGGTNLIRASGSKLVTDFKIGQEVFVYSGATNAKKLFYLKTNVTTIGVSPIVYDVVNAGITSYTNPADNRVLTSVSSSEINAEANLTFNGSVLTVNSNSSSIGSSGTENTHRFSGLNYGSGTYSRSFFFTSFEGTLWEAFNTGGSIYSKPPIVAIINNETPSQIKSGLHLMTTNSANNTYAPALTFGADSVSGGYHNAMGAITAKKLSSAYFDNFSTGQLEFFATRPGSNSDVEIVFRDPNMTISTGVGIGYTSAPQVRGRLTVLEKIGINNSTPTVALDVIGAGLFTSNITANSFIKSGGTSSQFLKGDGSVDANTYLTTSSAASTYLPLTGGTLTGALNGTIGTFTNLIVNNTNVNGEGILTLKSYNFNFANKIQFGDGSVIRREIIYPNSSSNMQFRSYPVGTSSGGYDFYVSNGSTESLAATIGTDKSLSLTGTLGVTGAATFSSSATANSFVKSGGTSSQFLKADGSVDSNTYITTSSASSTYLPLTGGTTTGLITSSFSNTTNYSTSAEDNNSFTIYNNTTSTNNIYGGLQFLIGQNSGAIPGGPGLAQIYAIRAGGASNPSTDLTFSTKSNTTGVLEKMRIKFDGKVGIGTSTPSYLLDVNGTLGVTGAATFSSSATANSFVKSGGTSSQFLKADGSVDANAYITGTGTINYLPKFTGTSTLGSSGLFRDANRFSVNEGTDQSFGWDFMANTSNPFIGNNVKASATYERVERMASTTLFNPAAIIFGYQRTNNGTGSVSYGGINFMTTSGNLAGDINPITYSRIFIEPDGNIGIGTMQPSYKFDIRGTLGVTGAATLSSTLGVTGLATLSGDLYNTGNEYFYDNTPNFGIAGKYKVINVYAQSGSQNTSFGFVKQQLVINNTQIYEISDSNYMSLTILEQSDLSIVSTTHYITYNNATNINSLATAMNNMTISQIGIITTWGGWDFWTFTPSNGDTLRAAALNAGLTKLGSSYFHTGGLGSGYGRRYVAVFYGGGGIANVRNRNVIEVLESQSTSARPQAYLYCKIITNNQFATILGSTSTNALYSAEGGYGANIALSANRYGQIGIGTTNPAYQLELSTDSAAKPTTSTWTISSDIRLKENIETADLDRCYDIVNQLPLKRYRWKDDIYGSNQIKDRSKLGWIAQDVESIFPKAVGITPFKYNRYNTTTKPVLDLDGSNIYDENGNIVYEIIKEIISEETIEDCKDLNVDQIYAVMYGTIKKLINMVEDNKTQIDMLKIEIDNLKSMN